MQATLPCPLMCPCFAGLRPRAPNTAVLTLRYGCGDNYAHCSPMAALYGIPASSQLKLRPSTPMGVQETKWIWFASNHSLPFLCPCFAGLRPRAPNTAVLTLRYGCGDNYAHCSPMAALYRIPASSQLKLRPSTPMGVQKQNGFSLQATHPCPLLSPCFAGLRPRAPNTAVLTLRHGCGDNFLYFWTHWGLLGQL